MRKIRVLVVEDSLVFRKLLVDSLSKDSGIEVVATANDPFEARDKIIEYKPDVMTLDVELPKMSGIEFLQKLMPQYPLPVVVISSLSDKVFDAMQAGAVDFVAKPKVNNRAELEEFLTKELPLTLKVASTAKVSGLKKSCDIDASAHKVERESTTQEKIVAIGASTGGTEAILDVVKNFNEDIPGTVVVQHMPKGFTAMYSKRLDDQCKVSVKEAEDGDLVLPGHVLIAPGGTRQMRLVKSNGQYKVSLKEGERVNGHCPSVEVLFDSVANVAKDKAVGVILTGMGGDGAKGLLKMRQAGARTIGQDESTCVVYGMPKVAYECGAVESQKKLQDISAEIYRMLNKIK